MKNKEWYTTQELVGLPGMPTTIGGVNYKAKTDNWEKRKPEGVKGRAFEYHMRGFPPETQSALTRAVTQVKETKVADCKTKMVPVPLYEVYASAGSGSVVEAEPTSSVIELQSDYLISQGISPVGLSAVPVKGDSMEPTLFDGDIVVIKKPLEPILVLEGIYLIRIGSELFIKRIQYNKFEAYMQVDSDNKFYRRFTIKNEDLNEIKILGEAVILLGRTRKRISETRESNIIREFAELQTRAYNGHQESEESSTLATAEKQLRKVSI